MDQASLLRMRPQWLEVDAETSGQRLDNFLIRQLKGVPKSHIYRIIRKGEVRVNKGRASPKSQLSEGDVVRIPPMRLPTAGRAPVAPAREFPVLFEDDRFLVVDKPSGVAVHGGSGVSSGMIEQLRQARPNAPMLELAHRLDRGTSGVLVIAKKRSALRALQAQFRQRQVRKTYLALVSGEWPQQLRQIDLPLHKFVLGNGERRVRVASTDEPQAMTALTRVRVKERWPDFTLLEVDIMTGRTHQIRVHLASQGCPIVGDDKYGNFDLNKKLAKRGLKRLALHACRLGFQHPLSQVWLDLQSPWPDDLPLPGQWKADLS